jgi:hypothetical protein
MRYTNDANERKSELVRIGVIRVRSPFSQRPPVRIRLECAGTTALWNWQTCLPVVKRRRAAAVQDVVAS